MLRSREKKKRRKKRKRRRERRTKMIEMSVMIAHVLHSLLVDFAAPYVYVASFYHYVFRSLFSLSV
jgi:hypothetical protein